MPGEWIRIGEITAPHGIKGEVRVISLSDSPGRFAQLDHCFLQKPGGTTTSCRIEAARPHKGGYVVKLAGVDSRDDALQLRHGYLVVPREETGPLPEGHFYVFQLVGLQVCTTAGEEIGTVKDVISLPANDVYIVNRGKQPDAYVPAVKQVVKEIDVPGGRIVIEPIPGMFDEGGS